MTSDEDAMTPEEHRDAASEAMDRAVVILGRKLSDAEIATYHATMGILEALLQMEICGHGTRGFCKDCFWLEFSNRQPIQIREHRP